MNATQEKKDASCSPAWDSPTWLIIEVVLKSGISSIILRKALRSQNICIPNHFLHLKDMNCILRPSYAVIKFAGSVDINCNKKIISIKKTTMFLMVVFFIDQN